MAKHLDLEEQEQLDQLKAFWARWGNLITWALIAVFGALAAYNGWNYWQRRQGAHAAVYYDEVERAAQSGDAERVDRSFGELRDRYGRTVFAQQGALLAAKAHADKNQNERARGPLAWAAEHGPDDGLRAVARLRLSALLMDAKDYEGALKQLATGLPPAFEALAADRRGDILLLQGKKPDATAEYRKAWAALEERNEYRRMVEVKLNALGVDPAATAPKEAKS
jgi:predicted negative regulator of RcsB-dependent stress response